MCKFYDSLEWRKYKIPYRNCSSDDNSCEYGSPDVLDGDVYGSTCDDCNGCAKDNLYFSMHSHKNRIGFDFTHKIKSLIIEPSSEMISINFCPWCGRKLDDVTIPFEKCCIGRELKIQIELTFHRRRINEKRNII